MRLVTTPLDITKGNLFWEMIFRQRQQPSAAPVVLPPKPSITSMLKEYYGEMQSWTWSAPIPVPLTYTKSETKVKRQKAPLLRTVDGDLSEMRNIHGYITLKNGKRCGFMVEGANVLPGVFNWPDDFLQTGDFVMTDSFVAKTFRFMELFQGKLGLTTWVDQGKFVEAQYVET